MHLHTEASSVRRQNPLQRKNLGRKLGPPLRTFGDDPPTSQNQEAKPLTPPVSVEKSEESKNTSVKGHQHNSPTVRTLQQSEAGIENTSIVEPMPELASMSITPPHNSNQPANSNQSAFISTLPAETHHHAPPVKDKSRFIVNKKSYQKIQVIGKGISLRF